MKLFSFEAVFRALNEADVRYLVVGGVAVNVHGYQRDRPRDQDDVQHLRWLREEREGGVER